MHDQPKVKCNETDEARKACEDDEKRKGELYQAQMAHYHAKKFSADALQSNQKLLLDIPDAYTFYNYEREILEHLFKNAAGQKGGDLRIDNESRSPLEWLREELKLNSVILQRDFKIYAAFVHRHWIFERLVALAAEEADKKQRRTAQSNMAEESRGPLEHAAETGVALEEKGKIAEALQVAASALNNLAPASTKSEETPYLTFLTQALEKEKEQCEKLLLLDERNFHAWNHRRWVFVMLQKPRAIARSGLGGVEHETDSTPESEDSFQLFSSSEAAEISYTRAVICRNFSNYSAWHQRALTLQAALRRCDCNGRLPACGLRERPAWLSLVNPSEAQQGNEAALSCALSRALARQLLNHLFQDLDLLIQAIYCDPNDQAAWFYSPFLQEVFECYEPLLRNAFDERVAEPAEDTEASKQTSNVVWTMLRESRGDFVDVMVCAVIDILVEERRLGEDDTCYLPYHYLLSNFARFLEKTQGGAMTAANTYKLQCYVRRTLKEVFKSSTAAVGDDDANKINKADDDVLKSEEILCCFQQLHVQLVRVDPLRKGMYDDLLSIALEWKRSKDEK